MLSSQSLCKMWTWLFIKLTCCTAKILGNNIFQIEKKNSNNQKKPDQQKRCTCFADDIEDLSKNFPKFQSNWHLRMLLWSCDQFWREHSEWTSMSQFCFKSLDFLFFLQVFKMGRRPLWYTRHRKHHGCVWGGTTDHIQELGILGFKQI